MSSYLRLSNATSDSCEYKVKLSNVFSSDYYVRIRITDDYQGREADSIRDYVETQYATDGGDSRYVRGEIDDLRSDHSYTFYAYTQAKNGTWYLAGEDDIRTEEEDNGVDFDLGIRQIYYRYADTSDDYEDVIEGMELQAGREIKFKLVVRE